MVDLVTTIRSIRWLSAVKICWLSANLILWLLGLGSCFSDNDCWLAMNVFLPFIYLLSLPCSVLFLVANEFFNAADYAVSVSPLADYTFLAFGSITFGYIQWFVLGRLLFGRRRGFTSIFMEQGESVVHPLQNFPEVNLGKEFVLFDSDGQTPLERIFAAKD